MYYRKRSDDFDQTPAMDRQKSSPRYPHHGAHYQPMDSLQQEKFHIGAAPINPSELGRNTKYVFALPARYNYAFSNRI